MRYHNQVNLGVDVLLDDVIHDRVFGAIEVDIHVPDELKEKFKEFTPIFKNTEVRFEDIGEFMQQAVEDHGFSKAPRKLLIGSYFGKQIGMNTPLLRWYLQHGLVVTRIYSFFQYRCEKVFTTLLRT